MEPATYPGDTLTSGSAPEGDVIIRIRHVTKVFRERNRTVTAVDDVSFDVVAGEIFGLLGPNGAGKSTLIRILTTLISPTSGTAFVGPYQVMKNDEEIRGIIGVCPQNSTLDVELTAYDNLSFYGKLLGVEERVLHDRAMQLLETADLTDRAHMPVRTFSGGMKRKLEIVRAFLHQPQILFLDEPTIGLDPDSRWEVWEQIGRLNREKTTIILTTHYMEEAERLCGRIAFMDRGKLIALDTPENHRRALPAGDLIEIGVETMKDGLVPAILATGLVRSAEAKENRVIISAVNGSRALPALIAVFERFSLPMTSISIRSPTLEDVFIHLTGRNLESGAGETTGGGRGGKR